MNKICPKPFTELNCMSIMCPCCPAWLSTDKFNVDVLKTTKTVDEIWNYDYAEFRSSIIDGSYKYCSDTCPQKISLITGDNKSLKDTNPSLYDKVVNDTTFIPKPTHLELCYDITCNLACKSCRPSILTTPQHTIDSLYGFYKPLFKHTTEFVISGDGDAFASNHYFSLLQQDLTELSPNLDRLVVQTNGILLTKDNFDKIHINNKNHLHFLSISIDAATEDTYKKVRGGNFKKLLDNLEFVKNYKSNLKTNNWLIVYSGFTVTKYNIHEVIDFIDLACNYNFNMIQFWVAREWDRWVESKDSMHRRYSDMYIDFNDPHIIELLKKIHEKIDSMKSKIKIHWMIDDNTTSTTSKQPNIQLKGNKNMHINTNPIINHEFPSDNINNSGIQYKQPINNTVPSKSYAIFCPFYISETNEGKWITNWIHTVKEETAPKYYTLSYPKNFDISKYKNIIAELDKVAICIKSQEYMYHTDALKLAHDYLKTDYSYMVHIEQDVILCNPISNHLVNTIISEDNDFLMTDISANSHSDVPGDIDVSVFVINLSKYDSSNYYTYTNIQLEEVNTLQEDKDVYNVGDTTKLHKLFNNIPMPIIHNAMNDIIPYIYNKDKGHLFKSKYLKHWIYTEMTKHNIFADMPIYIDSARAYPLHAFLNNKLSVVNGITHYAKHLKQSRVYNNGVTQSIDSLIEWYGYQPIGKDSPNTHIDFTPYKCAGLDIVIISKNQKQAIEKMLKVLTFDLPNCNRIFVLDRCTDGSKEFLESQNEFFIERHDAEGFCAGSARNLGLKYTNPEHDVLFLDGDRIPHNLNYERIAQMLYYFNISMIKNEKDTRNWFVNVPSINTQYRNYNNNVWSSAILLRRTAINEISNIVGNGNIFDTIFDGNWGCEDEYLGDVAYSLGMISGGFPSHIYVEGTTTPSTNSSDEYRNQVEKRNKLRSNLFNMKPELFNMKPELLIGNQPYLSKDERRELVNSIVSERRNVIRNMIKHRDRE